MMTLDITINVWLTDSYLSSITAILEIFTFYICVISNNESFVSQILRLVGLLEKSSNFSVLWDLKFKAVLIWKLQKSSSTQSEL